VPRSVSRSGVGQLTITSPIRPPIVSFVTKPADLVDQIRHIR
jgi:hypothetical protein